MRTISQDSWMTGNNAETMPSTVLRIIANSDSSNGNGSTVGDASGLWQWLCTARGNRSSIIVPW